jgi:trans-aconitate methyltransferase
MTTPGAHEWDPDVYARNAGFVPALGAAVLELLDARRGERILDLGCGDGVLTDRIVAAGAEVLGVDASPAMVDAARARGLDARVLDGGELRFDGEFDAVFSNAALHWMTDPDAVIRGVQRALRPGGRFVAEMGGHGCVAAVVVALVAVLARHGVDGAARVPWYFPTVADYGARLESAGFVVDSIRLVPRPTLLPGDVRDWLDTFASSFLDAVADAERAAVRDEVAELLRPCLCDEAGRWTADYVRLRFAAHVPGEPAARVS